MATQREPAIELLDAAAGRDAAIVGRLTELINRVYATAESGLWRDGMRRTTRSELAEFIAGREIAVATLDGQIAGSIRFHDISDDTTEFGILVAAPEHRGTGIGRALVDFAEEHSRERGRRAMQLELLVPRDWSHPSKEFLKSWYGHRGYRIVRTTSIEDAYPQLAPLLATPCHLEVYEKPLINR
jgi:GNAT superfamily N-acetyltransferase